MREFIEREFNKLLLTLLFLVMVGVVLWMGRDMTNVNWAREQAALILGGLLGLITGVAVGRAAAGSQQSTKEDKTNEPS